MIIALFPKYYQEEDVFLVQSGRMNLVVFNVYRCYLYPADTQPDFVDTSISGEQHLVLGHALDIIGAGHLKPGELSAGQEIDPEKSRVPLVLLRHRAQHCPIINELQFSNHLQSRI